jgi:Holliday junction resolvase-like predicted endonuclease
MTMSIDPKEKREELRQAVRAWLAERPAGAFRADSIALRLHREHGCTPADVEAACLFLKDLGQVKEIEAELGASVYWQIDAKGILAYEREG